jgi:hypothetical protein
MIEAKIWFNLNTRNIRDLFSTGNQYNQLGLEEISGPKKF